MVPDSELVIEDLILIDKRIAEHDQQSLVERWRFGKMLVAMRQGRKRLPNGALAEIARQTGRSRSELNYRMKFAEAYPTEAELSNALDSLSSWHEFCNPAPSHVLSSQEAKQLTARIRGHLDDGRRHAADVGRMLVAAREQLEPCDWLPLLKLSGLDEAQASILVAAALQEDGDAANRLLDLFLQGQFR